MFTLSRNNNNNNNPICKAPECQKTSVARGDRPGSTPGAALYFGM